MSIFVKYVGDGVRRSFKIGFPWGVISQLGVRVRDIGQAVERELARSEYKVVSDCVVYDLKSGEELTIYLASPLARAMVMQEERVQAAEAAGISAERALWYAQGAASLAEESALQALKEADGLAQQVNDAKEKLATLADAAIQKACGEIDATCSEAKRRAEYAIVEALKLGGMPSVLAVQKLEDIPADRPGFYLLLDGCDGHNFSLRNFTPVEYVNNQWVPCDHHHAEMPDQDFTGFFTGTLYHCCKNGRIGPVYLETLISLVKDDDGQSLAAILEKLALPEGKTLLEILAELQLPEGKSLADVIDELNEAIEEANANNANGLEQKERIDTLENLVGGVSQAGQNERLDALEILAVGISQQDQNEMITAHYEEQLQTAAGLDVLEQRFRHGAGRNRLWAITATGSFTVPVSGYYEIICIGGGDGGICWNADMYAGASGSCSINFAYLEKDAIIPVTIGAGGNGYLNPSGNWSQAAFDAVKGGKTRFGDFTCDAGWNVWSRAFVHRTQSGTTSLTYVNISASTISPWHSGYGRGGNVNYVRNGTTVTSSSANNGAHGAVFLFYFQDNWEPIVPPAAGA